MTLFAQVLHDIAEKEKPLSGTLLKIKVLTRKADAEHFKRWLQCEIEGYRDSGLTPPAYRRVAPQYRGIFHGPFQQRMSNVPLDPNCLPEKFSTLRVAEWPDSVAEIESTIASSGEVGEAPAIAESLSIVSVFREYGEQLPGYCLNEVISYYSIAGFTGMLDTVRSRLLEFLCQLAEKHPTLEEDDNFWTCLPKNQVDEAAGRIVYENCVFGDSYHNSGQAGSMGASGRSHDNVFNQGR